MWNYWVALDVLATRYEDIVTTVVPLPEMCGYWEQVVMLGAFPLLLMVAEPELILVTSLVTTTPKTAYF